MSIRLAEALIQHFQVTTLPLSSLQQYIERLARTHIKCLHGELRGEDFATIERFGDGIMRFFIPPLIRKELSLDAYLRLRDEMFTLCVERLWDELYAESFTT